MGRSIAAAASGHLTRNPNKCIDRWKSAVTRPLREGGVGSGPSQVHTNGLTPPIASGRRPIPAPRKTSLVYIWLHHKVGTRPDFGRVSRGASAASGRPTSHAGGPADPVGTRPVVRWARGSPRSPLRPGGMRCDAATRAAGPPTDECAECCHQHLSRSRRRRTSAWADQSSRLHHPRAAWQDVCIQCRRMHSRRLAAAAAAGAPTGGGAASRRAACRA